MPGTRASVRNMQAVALDRGMSLEDYLDAWLAHARARVRLKTYEGYEGEIRLYARPGIGALTLSELRPLDLQGLYSSLLSRKPPLSGGTVLNLHLVLTQALSQAVRWGLIASNPAAGAQPPRPRRKELAVLDQAGTERILSAVSGTKIECAVALAIATGMRRGEIAGLRWQDVSEDLSAARVCRTIQATKGGLVTEEPKTRKSRRQILLPAFLRPYLERQKADQARRRSELGSRWQENGLVIDRGDGAAYNPDSVSSYFAGMLRRKGLPHVRFHDLRHAHATLMLSAGVHPKIVSERLGHASIGITLDTYSHVLPSMQQEAADAFDELFACAEPGPGDSPQYQGPS